MKDLDTLTKRLIGTITPLLGAGASWQSIWSGVVPVNTSAASNGNRGTETRPRNVALLACIKYML